MGIGHHEILDESHVAVRSRESGAVPQTLVSVLEHLLCESVRLRDLYKTARRQSGGSALRQVRQVFDKHYREQLRIVDVLIERVRTLGGAGRIFAGDLLQSAQVSNALRGRYALARMLQTLLDSHESILSDAQESGPNGNMKEHTWSRDFAVGQVIIANEQQMQSVGNLLRAGGCYPEAAGPLALHED